MKNIDLNLRPGEIVEVLSQSEIVASLNENRELEQLPFTPEMWRFCGKRFKVRSCPRRIAVEPIGIRGIGKVVILEGATCNGNAHGGCDRTCQLLWKEAWLKRVERKDEELKMPFPQTERPRNFVMDTQPCQSACLLKATSPLSWETKQDSGKNAKSATAVPKKIYAILVSTSLGIRAIGKKKHPITGKLKKTPTFSLGLQPGEIVEVKSEEEILETLDLKGRNRGLVFGEEMLKFCGKKFRVLKRVERAITEVNGQMRQVTNTVILESVTCDGSAHGGCPRNCFCLWREVWLTRAKPQRSA